MPKPGSTARAQYARDDSSDDEVVPPPQAKPEPQAKREAAFLDKDAVLAAALSIGQPTRLPSVMTEDVRKEWDEWHKSTPTCLAEMPIERRAHAKFAMPMKCRPAGALVQTVPEARPQVELIAYRNTGGKAAAGITKDSVQRNAEAHLVRRLTPADVPKSSTVAFRNAALEEQDATVLQIGEGTPFLLGDVIDFELEEHTASSSSSAAAGPFVSRVLLHYRMPYAGEAPSNDPTKPWCKSCLCRQKYNLSHERFTACKQFRAEAVGSTSHTRETNAYVDWQSADDIFETKVLLNPSQSLKADSKKRISQTNTMWLALLGLETETKATANATGKATGRATGKRRRGS
tara:strand:+ start:1176 stop:2213 length:1038 start_codon:yes stop_codon:yes gene_type:complete